MKLFILGRKEIQNHISLIIGLILFLFSAQITAQFVNDDIKVLDELNSLYEYPWAGGMNSMQFGEIDMNMDGVKDLIAFDREGNRNMCFINSGIPNTIDYVYQPSYASLLPDLFDWAIFADYNADGKTDIFTYSPGYASMMVYKNVSNEHLEFKREVYPYLTSYQGGGYVNIYVTYADYPGISDIDNDGDLDILTFWGLGSFVEMHKNMSMEKYGIPDSLDFEQVTYCWGHFAENDESNQLYLDTCLISSDNYLTNRDDLRHTGSTLLLIDLDADNDKDLLLGDVDYPGLYALINGGDQEEAHITSVDTSFPSSEKPIYLFSMPIAANIDVNNDNKKDLIVSAFDPSIIASEDKHSVWLYINKGVNNSPDFELHSDDFLQSQMLDQGSGAYPIFHDWNKDGLTDLFIGNYGSYQYSYYENYFLRSVYKSRLSYYENTGSINNPAFQLLDNNFGNLWNENLIGIFPAFADLNGDGSTDLLVGNENGNLIYLQNKESGFEVIDDQYFNIDVGEFSTPQLFDVDKDGVTDLIVGEKAGNVNFYRNEGTNASPDFVFITDSLGKINVTDPMVSLYGYSTPWFFRDQHQATQLIVGSEKGQIYYYTNIDGNLDGKFNLSDELYMLLDTSDISFDRGIRTGATMDAISQNGEYTMIAGNYSGGLEYFNGTAEITPGYLENVYADNISVFPNPARTTITIKSSETINSVSILTTTGELIYQTTIRSISNNKIVLDTSELIKGIYLVRIETKERMSIKKLVIQ